MKIPLIQWLLQGIPENLALACLILALAGRKLKLKNVLIIGLLQAVVLYVVRSLPITFGVHTIVAIISLALFLNLTVKEKFSKGLLFSLISYVVLGIFETSFLGISFKLLGLNTGQMPENVLLVSLLGLPQVVATFLLALLVNKIRKPSIT